MDYWSNGVLACGNEHPKRWTSLLPVLAILFQLASFSHAAELTLKVADKEPPNAIDASIRAKLQTKAVQLLDGEKPAYELWFSREIPLRSKPASTAKALDTVKETTLLGVVAVPSAKRDYRDDEIPPGVYTLRFAFQPQNGDHLGTADYETFAVLVSSKFDTKPDGLTDFKALIKASEKGASAEHPMILSLRPVSSDEGDLPKLNEPAPEHKSVRVKLPAKAGEEKTSLVFELVYEGKGKK